MVIGSVAGSIINETEVWQDRLCHLESVLTSRRYPSGYITGLYSLRR